MKKILTLFLLVLLFGHLGFRIFQYRERYREKFDPKYWEKRYLDSQWVISDTKESIGDDGLYSYAGWEYIHGKNPTLLNAEMPPLGKYLIGISILIFKNRNIFAFLVGILVILAFYQFNFLLFKDQFWALFPTVFFSLESLFINQFRAPFLDTLYLLFIILTFKFFLQEEYWLAALFLGCAVSTKGTTSTFSLVVSTTFLFLFAVKKREKIFSWLQSLPLSLLVLLLSYARYFLLGHSLREFFGVQKWVLNFYTSGAKGTFAMVFPMLLLNRWHTWWGGTIKIEDWNIFWPILSIASLIVSPLFILKIFKQKSQTKAANKSFVKYERLIFLQLWTVLYIVFLSFIPVWPRYLLLVLPFQYTISSFLLKAGIDKLPTAKKVK